MFDGDEDDRVLPEITLSLQGQLTDEGVTDVLVLECNDPFNELTTSISLTHESVGLIFPIFVGFALREETEEEIINTVRAVAQGVRDQQEEERRVLHRPVRLSARHGEP